LLPAHELPNVMKEDWRRACLHAALASKNRDDERRELSINKNSITMENRTRSR
jgi:hypothetical protein